VSLLFLLFFAGQFDTAFRSGLVALNEGNLNVAEAQLQAASQLEPKDARVWLALARTYWRLHKLPAAQSAAATAEGLASNATVLHGLAVYYSETRNPNKAISLFRAAIRGDPFVEGYYFDLAQFLMRQQNFAAVLETLQPARQKFDKSAQLEVAAGVAYYGLRRFPEAIDAFLRTVRLDPGVEQPYVFLGRMLDQAEDKLPQITAVFAAFAKASPDHYLSSFLYAKSLRLEDPDRAEALLRKSIAQNREFWESHLELGVLLDEKRQFEEAAREIRRSIELNSADPAAHYRLARLYDRLGKPAEARAERERHARLSGASGTAIMK
jgi:tetratricopeptide (TPR) repeat protein